MSRRRPSRSRADWKHKRATHPRPLKMIEVVAGKCLTTGCKREALTFCDECSEAIRRGNRMNASPAAEARDPAVWILARSSAKWHRLGPSRTPKADALPGEQVLCGWKVTREGPLSLISQETPRECVTCNREANR